MYNKNIINSVLLLSFLLARVLLSQEISFEGSVICEEQGISDQKRPAKYIIVIPQNRPDLSEISTDFGYYSINLPYKNVIDQTVTFIYVGISDTIEKQKLFISREDIWNRQIKCPNKFTNQTCESFENDYINAVSKLYSIKNKILETSKLDLYTTGIGALSNLLYFISLLNYPPADAPPDSIVKDALSIGLVDISKKEIIDGIFLRRAYSEFSQNIGFNFTPHRNLNEAIFWNASSLIHSTQHQISLHSDYKRYLKFNSILKANKDLVLGIGLYWLFQDEERTELIDTNLVKSDFDSDELLLLGAFSYRYKRHFTIGFSTKLLYQNVQYPIGIIRTTRFHHGERRSQSLSFIKQDESLKKLDFDLSATIEPVPYLRIGISLMNLLGTKLHGNEGQQQNIRAFGLGITFQKKRINIGGEINLNEKSKGIFAVGINYIPFNQTLFNFGFSSYKNKVSVGFNYRNLFYSYNTDEFRGIYHLFGTRYKF